MGERPGRFGRGDLVANIRDVEGSLGDGVKRVHDSELPHRRKLRRVLTMAAS